jgi:hypothetical protein
VELAPSDDGAAGLLLGWSRWEAKSVNSFFASFAGGLAVYFYLPQGSDFTVELPQHTSVVCRLCTLTTSLKVPFDLFKFQLFAAVNGDAPQARKVSFRFSVQELPQVR